MADWYYTTDRRQRGPVSANELRSLAERGLLRPTDLVWQDGMSEWARADEQEFFPRLSRSPKRTASRAGDDAEHESRPRRSRPLDEYEEEEERPRRKRARPREDGMPVGVKVGLIVGGVVVLLIVVGLASFFLMLPGRPPELVGGMGDFNGVLGPFDAHDPRTQSPSHIYKVNLVGQHTYLLELKSAQLDSYLIVEDGASRLLAQDDDSGRGVNGLDARIVFACPRTGSYRIIATCLHQGQGAYTLSIHEK